VVRCKACKKHWGETSDYIGKVASTHACWTAAPFYKPHYAPYMFPGLMRIEMVKAKFNPTVKCDARCTNTIGPACSCSCGGANHGGQPSPKLKGSNMAYEQEQARMLLQRAKREWGKAWNLLSERQREAELGREFLHMVAGQINKNEFTAIAKMLLLVDAKAEGKEGAQ
jgi:hypothetical protein